ncbi:phage integrase N-terminal SAM-like domain-containing protein [archaeon]|nr:phage integrase N-terminal SAM-like domain-containing protein [archaeon]
MDILEAMKKEMFRRKLSHRTMEAYLFYVRKFLMFCRKEPRRFSKKDCREFLEQYMGKDVAGRTLNVALNSLRFMMEEVLRKSMRLGIKYSKTPKELPVFLSKGEVRSLLNVIGNPKHKLLVSLIYSAGLRVSEAVNLKPKDIDSDLEFGWVRHGKGNKDRPFIISSCLKSEIKGAF